MPKNPKQHQPSEAPGSTELNNLDNIVKLPPSPEMEDPTSPSEKKTPRKEQHEREDPYHE